MNNLKKACSRKELKEWSEERETEFKKVISFLIDSRYKLVDEEGNLHKALIDANHVFLIKDIDEVYRELRIVLRRLELFNVKYRALSENTDNFRFLKNYLIDTSEFIEETKEKWNMLMHQIDIALRII